MCLTDSPSTLYSSPSHKQGFSICTVHLKISSPFSQSPISGHACTLRMCVTDAGPALYLQVDQLYCLAMHCNVNRFRTAKLRPLFWKFFLNFWTYDPFSPRVQNLLASRQRGGMKSREVKQSREIKQSQTKHFQRKNLESSANGQGNVGCRRCTSILHLIQLWICLCLYFYISICI